MVLSTLFATLHDALKFSRALSSGSRRHMRIVKDADTDFKSRVMPALEKARAQGKADEIKRGGREGEEDAVEKGQVVLFESGRDIEVLHKRIENSLRKPFFKELNNLKRHVDSSGLDQGEKGRLNAIINKAKQELKAMFQRMLDDLKAEYSAGYEASVGKAEHRFINRTRGVAVLARAMRAVYKLRSDKRTIEHEVDAFEEADQIMERELSMLDEKHRELEGKIMKEGELLAEDVEHLVEHVTTMCDRFVMIIRVFTAYFFIAKDNEGQLTTFLNTLGSEHFPEKSLAELRELVKRGDMKAHEMAVQVADIIARLRHVPSEQLAQAA